jgi:hypothetical protein
MPPLDASLSRPKLDTTLILDGKEADDDGAAPKCALFSLVSLNAETAPSAEIPWSQLFALSLTPEVEPLRVLSVGRHKDCEVQLVDPRVSLHHFEIVARRKSCPSHGTDPLLFECILNDLSSNGTSINGRTVGKGNSEPLRSGDEICVLAAHRVGKEKTVSFLFRNTTELLECPTQVRQLDLEELVLCPICMQPIYKCVALMPCLHNFCMACFSEWMARKDDCPVCRRKVTSVVKNHPMEAIVDAFLEASPERRRRPEELKAMDAKDKLRLGIGGKVVREICTVGAGAAGDTSAPSARPQATNGAPAAPTRGINFTTATAATAAAAATTATAAAPTSSQAAASDTARAERLGSQICTMQ